MSGRIAFYGIVLALLSGTAGYFWYRSVPVQLEIAFWKLRHPNAKVATEGWLEVHQLYRTKWAAVEPVLARAEDEDPISFLVEREKFPVPGKAAREGFWVKGKPYYHKTDRIYCRTVGDAIRAIFYNETDTYGKPRWKKDFFGDWDAWWQTNKGW